MYDEYITVRADGTLVLDIDKWLDIEDPDLRDEVFDYFMSHENGIMNFN